MKPVLEQLTLETIDETHFLAPPSFEHHIRSYGGHLVAQGLLAAGRTVADDRVCNSLHAYFIRPGSTVEQTQISVDTVRDGRSFSLRQVDVMQEEKLRFRLLASFHRPEPGPVHQAVMPDVPAPETLPAFVERFAGRESMDDAGRWFDRTTAFDLRFAGPTPLDPAAPTDGRSQYWVRFREPMPPDPRMHQVLVAYVSDMFVLDPVLLPHSIGWTDSMVIGASLDHAMWFHHELDVAQWLLFDQDSSVSAHGRGLARAQVWTQDGRLVATLTQEGLLRPPYVPGSRG